ncbi:MAG TPA: tRNA 4-thiouridine(8) synthase ThiI [Desulfobacteraceae bacterium]|nr:tRNA 4-thiouridine(8) synthase ThiI [Deltaproteobacteria bacterium]HDI61194.1 tRNA 4-thiouridine(8) synthase ThiI [Desulfobacteraceae bacterium]
MSATKIDTPRPVRALGLASGGLDSMLAALVLRDQGIEVHWICFETPFFDAERARRAAAQLEIPLMVRDITPVYLDMLRNPRCGYGRHMNPCLDCHALMFRLAGETMAAEGFAFLFSGEVLGQRPMSQTRNALRYVEKNSGLRGFILRPLSALGLPETVVEQQGLVDRTRLLDIRGRGRKMQIDLAQHYGITDYPAPAGGCLLTDKGYADRLRDLLGHTSEPRRQDLDRLKIGRHLRLDAHTKIVVGRTQIENAQLEATVEPAVDLKIRVQGFPGPLALAPSNASAETVALAGAIAAGYSKAPADREATVRIEGPGESRKITVQPLPPAEARRFLI